MKSLATVVAAVLLAGAGVALSPAVSASAANDPNPWLWAYPQADFGGNPQGLWRGASSLDTGRTATMSVKNVSQSDACGFHDDGSSESSKVKFPFRAHASWPTIGKPFVNGQTLNLFFWGKC
ncbi:hypothetical protein [Kutzneria sp. 744]|uniref:hypothetical protein n=1 Tax=Kutzneria sp. (strain 744) TaxID=345341 RepID=UPI0004BB7CAA|nr:hypothetical protein [Kutzneria sp. 744]